MILLFCSKQLVINVPALYPRCPHVSGIFVSLQFRIYKTYTMAKLHFIKSGSQGNGYIIECENEAMVIELGLPFNEYNIPAFDKVEFAIFSHEHSDHLNKQTLKTFKKLGIPIFANEENSEKYDVKYLPLNMVTYRNNFKIQPIKVSHSVPCYGFIIQHPEIGKLLFLTDLNGFNYKIKDVTHIVIEANYDPDIIIDNASNNKKSKSMFTQHLSIDQTLEIIENQVNPKLKTINLVHLSSTNADPVSFKNRTKEMFSEYIVNVNPQQTSIEL